MSTKTSIWILTKDNTWPFIIFSLFYFLLLSSPFLYFSYLKSQPHKSVSCDWYEVNKGQQNDTSRITSIGSSIDTMNIVGESEIPLNEFDGEENSRTSTIITNNVSNWRKDADSRGFLMLTRIAIFGIILAFGALGASVSLITRTRNNEQLENQITLFEIFTVQSIGAIFAGILGFAFMGNMLAGTIFPNPEVFLRILYVPPAFAKLIVWSFIAGFSERFVPNVLNNLVQKSEAKQQVDN